MKKGDANWHRLFCFRTSTDGRIAIRRKPVYRCAMGTQLSLCDGNVVALVGTDIPLTRTADLLFFVVQEFLHV